MCVCMYLRTMSSSHSILTTGSVALSATASATSTQSQRRNNEQQHVFTRQATILRKNLFEWDTMLNTPRGETWPTMIGRLNAALNQTVTLDKSIDDVLEHFVYVPKQAPVNPQDIPFFLSTRLDTVAAIDDNNNNNINSSTSSRKNKTTSQDDAIMSGNDDNDDNEKQQQQQQSITADEDMTPQMLRRYEQRAARLAQEFDDAMVRF